MNNVVTCIHKLSDEERKNSGRFLVEKKPTSLYLLRGLRTNTIMDLYLVRAKKEINYGYYDYAKKQLDLAKKIGKVLSPKFFFFSALISIEEGKIRKAVNELKTYLDKANKNDIYYAKAENLFKIWNQSIDRYKIEKIRKKKVVVDKKKYRMWQGTPLQKVSWKKAKNYCATMTYAGFKDWRLPGIDEIRSIITGCESTQSGGTCKLTDKCISENCYNEKKCMCIKNIGPGEKGN